MRQLTPTEKAVFDFLIKSEKQNLTIRVGQIMSKFNLSMTETTKILAEISKLRPLELKTDDEVEKEQVDILYKRAEEMNLNINKLLFSNKNEMR
jgi:hypothetical protein